MQKVYSGLRSIQKLTDIVGNTQNRYLLVCDSAYKYLNVQSYIDGLPNIVATFDNFTPNPLYQDVVKGVECFKMHNCNGILAIGGGSTLDVAKCIKLFSALNPQANYLEQQPVETDMPLIAVPTTAGTGSEGTHFAVIYFEGKKYSVAHPSLVPSCVILDAELLKTLPDYQKKCTMLDALCHSIESWWCVNSTEESIDSAKRAIRLIIQNKDAYLAGNLNAAQEILQAAYYAGRAINISKTTAPHAMSYKLTSLYNIPHGHAVALCLPKVWQYMNNHLEQCVDLRGTAYLQQVFSSIALELGAKNADEAVALFEGMLRSLNIHSPSWQEEQLQILASSVNAERLKNNPIKISNSDFAALYREILTI